MRESVLRLNSLWTIQRVTRGLCIIGIGVALYLAWTHFANTEVYCGATHSCADVQSSSYSEIAGVPVSIIGLMGYLVLLTLSLLRGRVNSETEFYLPVLSFGATLIGFLYSLYLTYLEAYVIQAWCYWCVTSALIITALLFVSIYDLRKAWTDE